MWAFFIKKQKEGMKMILNLLLIFNVCGFGFAVYLMGSMFYEAYQNAHQTDFIHNVNKKEGE